VRHLSNFDRNLRTGQESPVNTIPNGMLFLKRKPYSAQLHPFHMIFTRPDDDETHCTTGSGLHQHSTTFKLLVFHTVLLSDWLYPDLLIPDGLDSWLVMIFWSCCPFRALSSNSFSRIVYVLDFDLHVIKLGFKRHCTLKNNQLGHLQLDIFLALASDPAVNFWRSQTQLPDLQDLVPGQSESKSHSGHLPVLRSQLCESKYFHEEKKN